MGMEVNRLGPGKRRGMSFFELLVAMALLSLLLLALAPLFMFGAKVNASSKDLAVANTLAREKLDELMMYPTTDPRLLAGAHATNDLPAFWQPSTGRVSWATSSPGDGWYAFPCTRTYLVQAVTNAGLTAWAASPANPVTEVTPTLAQETSFGAGTLAPSYNVKILTVTVGPAAQSPFPGLRRTVQTAWVRFRHG